MVSTSGPTVYRWRDVEGQVGKVSFVLYQIAFFAGQIFGVAIGQGVSAWAGSVTGFAIYIVFTAAALVLAKTPDIRAPWIFGSNPFLAKFFYLAFYSVRIRSTLLTSTLHTTP
jgi:solute carrier family 6 GABA transporter-like protein 1